MNNCLLILSKIKQMKKSDVIFFESKDARCEEFYKFLSNNNIGSSVIQNNHRVMVTKKDDIYYFRQSCL